MTSADAFCEWLADCLQTANGRFVIVFKVFSGSCYLRGTGKICTLEWKVKMLVMMYFECCTNR